MPLRRGSFSACRWQSDPVALVCSVSLSPLTRRRSFSARLFVMNEQQEEKENVLSPWTRDLSSACCSGFLPPGIFQIKPFRKKTPKKQKKPQRPNFYKAALAFSKQNSAPMNGKSVGAMTFKNVSEWRGQLIKWERDEMLEHLPSADGDCGKGCSRAGRRNGPGRSGNVKCAQAEK